MCACACVCVCVCACVCNMHSCGKAHICHTFVHTHAPNLYVQPTLPSLERCHQVSCCSYSCWDTERNIPYLYIYIYINKVIICSTIFVNVYPKCIHFGHGPSNPGSVKGSYLTNMCVLLSVIIGIGPNSIDWITQKVWFCFVWVSCLDQMLCYWLLC